MTTLDPRGLEAARQKGREIAGNQPGALVEAFAEVAAAGAAAYLASQPAQAVKALEWSSHPAGGEQALAAGLGLYRIHANGDDWYLVPDHMGNGGKAAAQADYETRIRSALVAAPPPSGEVETEISPYEWLAQEFDRLAILRKMWSAHEVAAIIRRHDIERPIASVPPADGWRTEQQLADEILKELVRARTKFPGRNVTFAALIEEVGELATATFEEGRDRVRKEAVQVAVMAMRMVLDGDHTFDQWRADKGLDTLLPASPTGGR